MTRLPYEEAHAAVQRLGITTAREYARRYPEQPGLPARPHQVYPEWTGWATFLAFRASRRDHFLPLTEAMTAVKPLGIRDQTEYRQRYREQPGLPSNPQKIYADWPGWSVYLGKSTKKQTRTRMPPLSVTQALVRELNIRTRQAYLRAAQDDPRLSVHVRRHKDWPGWPAFLGVQDAKEHWVPYAEARALVHAQGWSDVRTYYARYREVIGLPSNPHLAYPEWRGWSAFLAAKQPWALPYAEASAAAQQAGLRTARDYNARYSAVPGLPSTPQSFYAEWQGWAAFLGNRRV